MSAGRRVLLVEEGGRGGVAHYTGELAGALARRGWEVHLATAFDHRFADAPGVHVHRRFPYVRGRTRLGRAIRRAGLSRAVNGATHLAGVLALLGLARRSDVVHVQGGEWPPLGALQAVLLRLTGRVLIYTPHNTFDRGDRAYPRAHAVIHRCASRIVVHSEYDRRQLPARLAAKTAVIPHGEYGGVAAGGGPAPAVAEARAAVGAGDDELVVLLFGQLRPDKGVGDLLTAARELAGVRVVLAGEELGALAESAPLLADPALRGRVTVRRGTSPPRRRPRCSPPPTSSRCPTGSRAPAECCCSPTATGAPSWSIPPAGCPSTSRPARADG